MASNETDWFGILEQYDGEPRDALTPNSSEAKLVAKIRERFEETREVFAERRRLQEGYRLMLKGETVLARTVATNEIIRIVSAGDPRRARSIDNLQRQSWRAFVGKLTKAVPAVRVQPRTPDREDTLAAEVMDSWVDFGWHSQKLKLKYKRAVACIPWAGRGIWHVYWDPLGGSQLAACAQCNYAGEREEIEQPCPICGGELEVDAPMEMPPEMAGRIEEMKGQLTPKLQKAFEGELKICNVHPFDFYPDPGATEPEDMQYAFVRTLLPVNVIRTMHPDKAQLVRVEDGLYADKFASAPNGSLVGGRIETVWLRHHAEYIKYFEMPSGKYEQGRIVSVACDRVMETKPNIAAALLGRLPFYFARGDVDEGELDGEEIMSQTGDLQRERDTLLTQVRRHRELVGNPKWKVTGNNTGIDRKVMDTTPGEIIKVRGAGNISPIQLPPMPNYVPNEMERLKLANQEKWGVTPYEMGQTDAGASGRFAAFLDTQANALTAPMAIEINAEWLELHRAWIILGQHYMPNDRIWTVTGQDKVLTYSWERANVRPGWDVYLAEEDSVSKNPIMRLQEAKDLLKLGFFNEPTTGQPDMKRFRRFAGLRMEGIAPDDEAAQRVYAAQIPEMIRRAFTEQNPQLYPRPRTWHHVWVIIEELLGWLRTRGLTEESWLVDEVEKLYILYVQSVLPDDPNQMIDPMLIKLLPNQRLAAAYQSTGAQSAPSSAGVGPGAVAEPNIIGGVPSAAPTSAQETVGKIQGADAKAEGMARMQTRHEG